MKTGFVLIAAPSDIVAQVEQLRSWRRKAVMAAEPARLPWAGVFQFRLLATTMWFARRGAV